MNLEGGVSKDAEQHLQRRQEEDHLLVAPPAAHKEEREGLRRLALV
jgi:hypothetical protein